jgi:Ser/Thr protein kinase RdoA (MazF antagonist)
MNIQIKSYFTDEIAMQAAGLYGSAFSDLILIRSGLSVIYSLRQAQEEFILRITHSSVEDKDKIAAEVDWLHYLQKNGANIATPSPSINGKLIEIIPLEDSYFSVTKFNKVPGEKVTQQNWLPPLFKETGRTTGLLHKLTKSYLPSEGIVKRENLFDSEFSRADLIFAAKHKFLLDKILNIRERIKNLSVSNESFGLVHNDIHRGNMFLNNGKIFLFDTADCAYTWFVADIALTLFFTVLYTLPKRENLTPHIVEFMNNYWDGYLRENSLPDNEIEFIPQLMTLRAIFIYRHLLETWDIENMDHVRKNFFEHVQLLSYEGFDFINVNLIKPQ